MTAPNESSSPIRPWRIIAREIANEHDPKRILQLSLELDKAFEEQGSYKAREQGHHLRVSGVSYPPS